MMYDNFRYDSAEHCADRALVLDPRFMKARYRRGLARMGNLELTRAAVGMCLPCSLALPAVNSGARSGNETDGGTHETQTSKPSWTKIPTRPR